MVTKTVPRMHPRFHPVAQNGRHDEPLLREALGQALRAFRADRKITLRELAESSCVSPGYLSELERGRKEVSSELLAAVCHALGIGVADVLIEAAGSMACTVTDRDLATVQSLWSVDNVQEI